MKYKTLPFIHQLELLKKEDAVKVRDQVITEFRQSPAAQILLSLLQSIETSALAEIRTSCDPSRLTWNAGRMAAVDTIRGSLVSLIPTKDQAEDEDPDEVEEEFLYESGFDIPVPGSRSE